MFFYLQFKKIKGRDCIDNRNGIYIPSVDAKDIYISNHYINEQPLGYSLFNTAGEYNLKRFINSFDYSLDSIKLAELHYRKHRRRCLTFTNPDGINKNKKFSHQIINVTFKYAVKEFNLLYGGTYIRFGYNASELTMTDGVCLNEAGELVAINIAAEVSKPVADSILSPYFAYSSESHQYKKIKEPKTLMSRKELRQELYKNGFTCNGTEYVRFKRSSGSARVGKCLFIVRELYKPMHKWELGGIKVLPGQEIDLAALEAYISLTTSSIIDTIIIEPKNILVIDDYESVFREDVIATYVDEGWLKTEPRNVEVENSIWDGQSLMDISLFGQYAEKGMLLLRNLMFKSCCFNCNIQEWFRDNGITSVDQLNGFTLAKKIEDVKLITTPSSVKYLKFGTLEQWLDNLFPIFGVVKYDKKTHYMDGHMVQTHYQLLNTLELNKSEVAQLLQPSLDYATKLRTDPSVVRYHIKYPEDKVLDDVPMMNKNDVVFHLLGVNNKFSQTKYYRDFLNDLLNSFYKNLKCGHILVNGNYSTLLGNPIEMLQASIGVFNGDSQLGVGKIHSRRFEFGKKILGSRSPHVCAGNILVTENAENELIDKYINLTQEIVCVNSIKENLLNRLSGCD